MVQFLTAHTLEADELEVALGEILGQLDIENNCLKNSAGLLFCHPDFIATGVAQGIAEALPFEVVGATTICTLTQGLKNLTGLTVSVITSDTVEFTTISLKDCRNSEEIIRLYKKASAGKSGVPSMAFPFASSAASCNMVITVFDQLTDGKTPLFGSGVIDNAVRPSQTGGVICNGTHVNDGIVVLLAWGELKARFFVTEISEGFIQKQQAIVTKSNDNIVMEINDICSVDYLESIGISREQANGNLFAVAFIINLRDGTKPFARGVHGLTPEGYMIASGPIPENAIMSVGTLDSDDITPITNKALDNILDCDNRKGLLLFPCVSHFWIMQTTPFDLIQHKINGILPYQIFYSGAEICPVYNEDGRLHNRCHSFTCIACSFE